MTGTSSLTSKSTAASSRSPVDSIEHDTVFDTAVTRVVNEVVFPLKQFIVLEEEMDVQGRLATRCLQELNVDDDKNKWHLIKEDVRKRLNYKRNNVQSSLRRSLTKYMEVHGTESIELRRILLGRKDREMFHWFLDHIASVAVGVTKFEQWKSTKRPCEWLSGSMEAFCLVCMENFFEMVQKRVSGEDKKADSLWTCGGRGKKKNQGWDKAGIRRYNHLVHVVRMDREALILEDEIYKNTKLEERQQLEMERLQKKKEKTAIKERGWEAAEDDL